MAGLTALIPLDGTKLSESAYSLLPMLHALGFDTVRLVSVWESAWEATESGDEKQEELSTVTEKGRSYLTAYLRQQAEVVESLGFRAEKVIRVGRPADELIEAAQGLDLILIATHGRTGISRWWLGSVADEVVKQSGLPCLVIGPNVEVELSPFSLQRILVPLDGSEMAESALPLAVWIARRTGAEIEIVRCMSLTTITYDPGMSMYSAELITSMEDSVRAYLEQVAARLEGVKVTTRMMIGAAGEMLLEHMKDRHIDLVVTTSHGRTGLKRAALGSVTDRLLHGTAPVLVFRPQDEKSAGLVAAAEAATGA